MRTLTEIMNAAGSDKGTVIDGWEAHEYTPHYERWFAPLREQPIRLLEIGVCDPRMPGASLQGWYEYFPKAMIFGFDIVDASMFDNDRIKTFQGDQSDPQDLRRFVEANGGDFDVIIDDGSHLDEHQQASLAFLIDYLCPRGQYIIEDMQVSPNTVDLARWLRLRRPPSEGVPLSESLRTRIRPLVRAVQGRRGKPFMSKADLDRVCRQTKSVDLLCNNKLARLIKV